ncbi:MAG: galactose mutarotase [Bacteroidales bacterium]|nr:galactose mutarotase [Bacteroidales bacterium]
MKKLLFGAVLALMFCGCRHDAPRLYTLRNTSGMEVCITDFGGRIVSLNVPDREGVLRDVVLGFDRLEDYYPENNQTDFGAAIGRYANRIDHGHLCIDGKEYQLPVNNFGHTLHGGPEGWQYKFYEVVEAEADRLVLRMSSPDGDQNFPGNVEATVTYTLTDDNALDIRYEAVTDAPTVINMTNHAYFNLSGNPAEHRITDDILYLNASAYTPVDDTFMTTGEILPVEGTPFDFREPKLIGRDIDADDEQLANGHGYDHNWVLDTAGDINCVAAELYCPETGIDLKVFTDEPGIQVYAGNFLDGTVTGKGGVVYAHRTAICLETQHYPDSPNKPDWPSVVLRPAQTYSSHCIFSFSTK